jgi:hypothetical protein
VLITLATGTPLLAADGGRIQLSPNGQGFISGASGARLYGAHGQPLSLVRHHKSRQERVASVLAALQRASDQVGDAVAVGAAVVLLNASFVGRWLNAAAVGAVDCFH